MGSKFYRMMSDSSGQGVLEYALIISIVAVAAIVALVKLGSKANNSLTNSANAFPT